MITTSIVRTMMICWSLSLSLFLVIFFEKRNKKLWDNSSCADPAFPIFIISQIKISLYSKGLISYNSSRRESSDDLTNFLKKFEIIWKIDIWSFVLLILKKGLFFIWRQCLRKLIHWKSVYSIIPGVCLCFVLNHFEFYIVLMWFSFWHIVKFKISIREKIQQCTNCIIINRDLRYSINSSLVFFRKLNHLLRWENLWCRSDFFAHCNRGIILFDQASFT